MCHPASILHDKNSRTCYLCVTLHDNWNEHRILDEHHIFGGPNRKNSEEYGLKYTCVMTITSTVRKQCTTTPGSATNYSGQHRNYLKSSTVTKNLWRYSAGTIWIR